jgi:hypothetical protein
MSVNIDPAEQLEFHRMYAYIKGKESTNLEIVFNLQ